MQALLGAACAVAAVGVAAPAIASADQAPDSVGLYSEELEGTNSPDPVAVAQAQAAAGSRLVREPFSWQRIEKSPGRLDFREYDEVMAAAAIAGLAVLPVIMDPPPWRSTAPLVGADDNMYPPADLDAMAVLGGLLARRYGPGGSFWAGHPELTPAPVHSWQIWNEPNIRQFWASGPDPAEYVRMLRIVGHTIRAVDPTAEIVAAGLPYGNTDGIAMTAFIDAMYAAGARGTFDTLAIHPYASDVPGVIELLRIAREHLDANGDRARPIWVTELGWATRGEAVTVTVTVSEAGQAALLRSAATALRNERAALRLRGLVVFRWRDVRRTPGQRDVWPLNSGLLRTDGSSKPALAAFTDAAAIWRGTPGPVPAGGSGAAAPDGPSVLGVERRILRVRRFVEHRRLYVRVDVPPGGGGHKVRIAYEAIRDGRVIVRRTVWRGTRRREARVAFELPRSARSADSLRVFASHGGAQARRDLRLRTP